MARTRSQITRLSAARIREQNRKTISWVGMLRALSTATTPDKEIIISAIQMGNVKQLGVLVITQINKVHQLDADAEVNAIFADDQISMTELDRIL